MILIIANVLSFIGNALWCSSSMFKNKKTIISLQTTNHALSATAQAMQKAYSGMVQDASNLVKNIILLFVKETKRKLKIAINIVFIALAFVLGLLLNIFLSNSVWYGFLPVASNLMYGTIVLISYEGKMSERKATILIKIALVFNSILWGTYGMFVKLYAITAFNAITLVLSIISIITSSKNNSNDFEKENVNE